MADPSPSVGGWIDTLVSVAHRLDTSQLHALAEHLEGNPLENLTVGQLQRRLGLGTLEAGQLSRSLEQLASRGMVGHDLQIALSTLVWSRQSQPEGDAVEIVCTAPSQVSAAVRTTFAAAGELIESAREELLVLGYVFTEGAAPLLEKLAVARRDRLVRVVIIGDRLRERLADLRALWPPDSPAPSVFSRDRRANDMSSLHAKTLIRDGIEAVITSANFSFHGLHQNVEIGVKVKSPRVAALAEFVKAMIAQDEFAPLSWV